LASRVRSKKARKPVFPGIFPSIRELYGRPRHSIGRRNRLRYRRR
jgi:hypothetical protein